jgi:hypothetical protein
VALAIFDLDNTLIDRPGEAIGALRPASRSTVTNGDHGNHFFLLVMGPAAPPDAARDRRGETVGRHGHE